MSRGFGSTYGTGATDAITTGYTKSGSDKRSYFIWYYRNGAGGGNFGNLFFKNNSEQLQWNNTFSSFNYRRCNSAGVQTGGNNMGTAGTTGAMLNVWNALLVTHDQSSGALTPSVAFYNGRKNTSNQNATGSLTPPNDTDPFIIGNTAAGNRNWDGFVAHATIWDDIILGEAEAWALTAGAHPMTIAPANLVAYLPLDGIHTPEMDFIVNNGAASITGAKYGTLQPLAAPIYIPFRTPLSIPFVGPAVAPPPTATGLRIPVHGTF